MVDRFAKVCAIEGQSVGINWSFSPVCDLDLNCLNPITNVHSYGSDTERAKRNTEIYVRVMQECGVAACAKHFPGNGVDYRDCHLHPTYNTLSAKEWYASYGTIFGGCFRSEADTFYNLVRFCVVCFRKLLMPICRYSKRQFFMFS